MAIERTRVETPAVVTRDVYVALDHLQGRAAALEYEVSQLYGLDHPRLVAGEIKLPGRGILVEQPMISARRSGPILRARISNDCA